MSIERSFGTVAEEWAGCGRDSFDHSPIHRTRLGARVGVGGKGLITETIEAEIIPRLMVIHQVGDRPIQSQQEQYSRPTGAEVAEFVGLLLSHDIAVASAYVEGRCNRGLSLESIFLDLLSPAARMLGKLWEEDICDFTDVTIALSRLQQLLRELGAAFEIEAASEPVGRSALLVAAPGDQHTFGVFIVQEFFRRAGWEVAGGSLASPDQLFGQVQRERYDLVGLSVSNEVELDGLAATVETIRRVALSPGVRIMVGGRFFLEHPDCVARIGADATAEDGRQAVAGLSSLLRTNALS